MSNKLYETAVGVSGDRNVNNRAIYILYHVHILLAKKISASHFISSFHLQTGLWFVPPEPKGGGLECGVGQRWRKDTGHPQGEEPDQLSDALSSQVCLSTWCLTKDIGIKDTKINLRYVKV